MKILLVDNSAVVKKGNSYFTNNLNALLLKDLITCGNKITYFHFAIEKKYSINVFDLRANGIKYEPLKFFNNKLIRYFYAYIAIIPKIKDNDFIYFYYPTSFKYATFVCKLLGKKYGLYVRGEQDIEDKISLRIYKNAFTIFTVSDFFTIRINRITGKKTANTIRPMISYTDKDIVLDRAYSRTQNFKVLFLSRIAYDKGIEELLNAAFILLKKGCRFELDIVGSGEFIEEAMQIASNLSINDIVKFHGPVYDIERIKEYYTNADIYILPTYHEGFPRTLYEAMIFGTPIITTLVGGIPSLMRDAYNCKSIEPKSIDSIIEGLRFAFQNYEKMIEFAKNGTKTVYSIVDSKRLTHGQHLDKILKHEK